MTELTWEGNNRDLWGGKTTENKPQILDIKVI